MKLEVGKSYRDRDGNVWKVEFEDSDDYRFRAVSGGISQWFTQNGSYTKGEQNQWDLVLEVTTGIETEANPKGKTSFEEVSKLAERFMVGLLAKGGCNNNFDYMAHNAFLAAESFVDARSAYKNQK